MFAIEVSLCLDAGYTLEEWRSLPWEDRETFRLYKLLQAAKARYRQEDHWHSL